MLVGSCFTDHIGQWLSGMWLKAECNPWGVLFNPASIAQSLKRCVCGEPYVPELHELGGRYFSFDHHGKFSSSDPEALTQQLRDNEAKAAASFASSSHVIITLGTAWVYERQGRVVANCHRFPASDFTRRLLSVDEIVELFTPLLSLDTRHSALDTSSPSSGTEGVLTFTVSPIRHVRDGLHANQLSKATLLMAIDRLQQLFPDRVSYLPVYELFIDDLRDYRFYADDLVHPSPMGIEFVKELVSDCCFSPRMKEYVAEATAVRKALDHRPSDPDSPQHREFVRQTLERRDNLIQKYVR